MPSLPKLRPKSRHQAHVDRPVVVTNNFQLHYEDVVHRHSKLVVVVFAVGLLTLTMFIPKIVHESVADVRYGAVEVESGKVSNPSFVSRIKGDITAGDNSYIEFSGTPCLQLPINTCGPN